MKKYLDILIPAINEACEAILGVYSRDFKVEIKTDHSPVTLADKLSSKILMSALSFTDEILISEEAAIPDYEERKNQVIWLIDPLDGTKEFIKRNDEFCISIARVVNGKSEFGLIVDVVGQKIIYGGQEYGSYISNLKNETPVKLHNIKRGEEINIINSRSHLHPRAKEIRAFVQTKNVKSKVVQKGSALKFFDLVENRVHLYPRFGPTMEWDIAGGQAIFEGVGGEVLNFSTFEPLRYNKEDLYNPGFVAKPGYLSIEEFYE